MRRDIALFLGLVAVIGSGVIAAAFFLFGSDGGGNSPCDQPLPPRGESEISQVGFQTEDAGLAMVIEAALEGNLEVAEGAFFGDLQDFIRNVDQPLRDVDEGLAKELCEAAIKLEKEFVAAEPKADAITTTAMRLRDLLWDAAQALGHARPGE